MGACTVRTVRTACTVRTAPALLLLLGGGGCMRAACTMSESLFLSSFSFLPLSALQTQAHAYTETHVQVGAEVKNMNIVI